MGIPRRWFSVLLLLVVLLTLAIRLIQFRQTHLIFDDTAHYIDLAWKILDGDLGEVARHPYHPGFAAAIAATTLVLPDAIEATFWMSVVVGTLAVIPLALLWRIVAGNTVGLLAGVAFAMAPYPVRFAAAGYSESLYFLFFFSAILFALLAMRSGSAIAALACGLASGLAYLVRPEGAGVFVVLIAALLVRLAVRRSDPFARRLRPLIGCALAFVILGAPYMVYKYKATGTFEITGKKSISRLLGLGAKDEQPASQLGIGKMADREWPEQVGYLASNLVTTLHYPFAVLLVLGVLFHLRKHGTPRLEFFLLALAIFFLVILYFLLRSYGYVSRRHLSPIACLGFGWAAMGMIVVSFWGIAIVKRLRPNRTITAIWLVPVLVVLAIAAGTLPKALTPQWREQTPIRDAGLWIAQMRGDDDSVRVCTPYKWGDPRIPIYAGVSIDQPTITDSKGLLHYLEGTRPRYLGILSHRMGRNCADPEAVRNHPRLEKVFSKKYADDTDRWVEIYRFLPEQDANPESR